MKKKQTQITQTTNLLDKNGYLPQPGYATQPLWKYDRSMIKAGWHRIKEWDYYAVLSQEKGYGISFTMSDLGYLGLFAVCWLDFNQKTATQLDQMTLLPRGKTGFPADSDTGKVTFQSNPISLSFKSYRAYREIIVDAPNFKAPGGMKGLSGKLTLQQDPTADSMVIASSWKENSRAFYYNRKINTMPVTGEIVVGDETFSFSPEHSFGVLDWGRGNWTYKNRWFWGSASGKLNGESFGWNLGYGFSDRSAATENMLFYQGKAHKLSQVTFHFDESDYMKPWRVSSDDSRFEMDFTPIVDRYGDTNLILLKSIQHQVFGLFNGYVILDDGTKLEVRDFLGFAEDVLNWW